MINRFIPGLFKSPFDERDWLIRSFFIEKPILPKRFTRIAERPRQRYQKDEGSCGGQALASSRDWQECKDTGEQLFFSARDGYEKAKKISGHTEGTTLRALMEAAKKDGICLNKFWPYKANHPEIGPLPGADKNAAKYKIDGYARIINLDELKRTIYTGYPFGAPLLGMLLYPGAISKQVKETGIVPDPSCWDKIYHKELGGHAMCGGPAYSTLHPAWLNKYIGNKPISFGFGWDDESPFFKGDGHIFLLNSWGEDFGYDGMLIFSYKNIKNNVLDCISPIDKPGSHTKKILTIANISYNMIASTDKTDKLWI